MNPIRSLALYFSRIPISLLLVLIVALAGVIAFAVTATINEIKTKAEIAQIELLRGANTKGKVVYSVRDINEGEPIASDALEEKEVLKSTIPPDALASSSLAIGRLAKYGIPAGQLVSQHDLAAQGISLGFDARLKDGMRAVSFGIDNNSGVAGFINPDSRVDIMAMVGNGADTKVAPILSDVEIVAVGQSYKKAPGQSAPIPTSSVTVSVTPEDTTKLVKAISASKLYLALRKDNDHAPVATVDVTSMFSSASQKEVDLAIQQPPVILPPPAGLEQPGAIDPATAPSRIAHEIEVWLGSKKDVVSVPNP